MQIWHRFDEDQQQLELQITGPISAEETCGILRHAIDAVVDGTYQELVLDLRQAVFSHPASQDQFQLLLQSFISIVLKKGIRVTMLFTRDETEQWLTLNRARPHGGINVRYGTLRSSAWQLFRRDDVTCSQTAIPRLDVE